MRVVNSTEELGRAFQAAQAEAKSTFGNDSVYLERYFLEPRHIEVQIAADHRGHVVYLGERDCSIQRRHQKLVEETPSPAVDEKLRREIGRVAVEAVRPNPFHPVATLPVSLDRDGRFVLRVFRVNGALVRTLQDGPGAPGLHPYTWDGRDDRGVAVPGGVYLIELTSGGRTRVAKAVLLR